MLIFRIFCALLFAISTSPAFAQEDGSCVYNRVLYPEGTEMCQGGTLVRCQSGSWGTIGMCDGDDAPPPPEAGGGDQIAE